MAPVIRYALDQGCRITVFLSGRAASFLESLPEKVQCEIIDDHLSAKDCAALLADVSPHLLFSACGLYNEIEHTMRLAAKIQNLPILGILDSWHNYRDRFTRDASPLLFPDHLCAIDPSSQQGIIEAGMPSAQVSITGHPDLEFTAARFARMCKAWRKKIKCDSEFPADSLLYVFLSEPFYTGSDHAFYSGTGAIMRDDGTSVYGYTTETILPATATSLASALRESGKTATLVVRPHPSEWKEPLYTFAQSFDHPNLFIQVSEHHTTPEWLASAEAVFGMMTIALLHAAILHRPTVSVQIGLNESGAEDPCVSTQLGYIPLILSCKDLQRVCNKLVTTPESLLPTSPSSPIPIEGSTERVYSAMLDLINQQPTSTTSTT